MAKVVPFRGLRYASDKVPVEKVVTQPYDKISKEMQERYYALHPNNIVRIVLGKASPEDSPSNNVYTRAAKYLKDWRATGILEQVAEPSFCVYFQKFSVPDTNEVRVRKGFIGLGRLEDYANGVVFPHERTLTGPKKDRLELLRHTRTHFEQIFMLYEDPERRIDKILEEVAEAKPDIQVEDEYQVEHTLWFVSEPKTLSFIQAEMEGKKLIIADGHHRYETALAYRNESSSDAARFMAMTFFNMHSPALTILPTHRVVANLPNVDTKSFFEFFTEGDTIGVVTKDTTFHLNLKPSLNLARLMPDLSENQRKLDVVILHRLLLEKCLGISEDAMKRESHVAYVRGAEAATEKVRSGQAQIAFLLKPTRLDQMRDIAYEGNVMPQKSTDFYPKVLSGLLLYPLE